MDAVDNAMMRFGLPVGPIRLTDEVGIDVSYLVLTKSLGMKAPMALENVYKAGRFGRNKNGKGFYTKEGAVDPEALPLVNPQGLKKEMSVESLQEMLFLPSSKRERSCWTRESSRGRGPSTSARSGESASPPTRAAL
jgi:3-hydroxyacyl-CoA dehydrogenase